MSENLKLVVPELSDGVDSCTLVAWLKKEGDSVQVDEPVVEVMTDKVNIEVTATSNGVIKKILVEEGDTAEVGQELAIIEA